MLLRLTLFALLLGCAKAAPMLPAKRSGLDATRATIPIALRTALTGVNQPTDIQAFPGTPLLIVLEKAGKARWFDPKSGKTGFWFEVAVNTRSEQGLLGIAFHPMYAQNGRFFLNYNVDSNGKRVTRIDEWKGASDPRSTRATRVRTVLEVGQPYANHDAGQILFGPDGKLYVGMGDGGAADDPHGHGQNLNTLLGAMLRLDVDGKPPYAIPPDNPFVGKPGVRPEIWAYGLRNPWRYSFAPDGRLVVADVGQNTWEEITIVGKGENHGWAAREAHVCFPIGKACKQGKMVDPVYAYPRSDGNSVTGGYVYTGAKVPKLKGKYVFGDFGSGRLWALDLPKTATRVPESKAISLGRFAINPATFGVGHDGTLWIGDFQGRILEVVAAPQKSATRVMQAPY